MGNRYIVFVFVAILAGFMVSAGGTTGSAGDGVADAVTEAVESAKATAEGAADAVTDVVESAKATAEGVADAVTEAVESAKATAEGVAESVKEAAAAGREKAQDAVESVKEGAESVKKRADDKWRDVSARLKKIYDENIPSGWEKTKNALNDQLQSATDHGREAREYVNQLLGKTTDPEAARLRQTALEHLKKRIDHSYKHILKAMDAELKPVRGTAAEKDFHSFLRWYLNNVSDGVDKSKSALGSHL